MYEHMCGYALFQYIFSLFKVFVINLLADKKYSHFRPVLDTYIADLFSAAKAHE